MEEEKHLPVYGVGPYYGAGVMGSAAAGILLSLTGALGSGLTGAAAWIFRGLGAALLAGGILVWAPAALGKGSIDGYIRSNTLCTTGIYAVVRNPCYSGIMIACTGALLMMSHPWLLVLPPLYWLTMTLLMKHTEEKWLQEQYGDAYRAYCRRVNRCIPWFPRQ